MKKRALAAPFLATVAFGALAFADSTPPKEKLPKAPDESKVTRHEDGTCWYYNPGHCPPGVHCNPPPPHQVQCPPTSKKGQKL